MVIRVPVLFGLIIVTGGAAVAETYVVQPDGSGDFPTIQAAIDAAVDGDVIELANGTFTGDGNRDIDFEGRAILLRSASEDPDSCIIDCAGSETDHHRAFYIHTSEDSSCIISSITMMGGYILHGGAVKSEEGSPTFTNCVFRNNTALDDGGAVRCNGESSPTFWGCRFVNNESGAHGGGVMCISGTTPAFHGCEFRVNLASGYGGGMYLSVPSAIIEDCTWIENTSYINGGGLCFWEGQLMLTHGEIRGNACQGSGGGLCLKDCHAIVNHSLLLGNLASGAGGGLHAEGDATVYVSNCTLVDNWTNAGGGGISAACCSLEVAECTIVTNFSRYGGGIRFGSGVLSPIVRNAIIAFNLDGPGISCGLLGTPALSCCDIYGNEGGDWVGFIASQHGINGNFSADPYFCDMDNDDYHLWNYSPCNQAACGIIGAWPVGCWDPQLVEDSSRDSPSSAGLRLASNTPNPFRTSTRISYSTPATLDNGPVLLTIHDASGRLVRTLVDTPQSPGIHEIAWNGASEAGRAVAGGMYFLQLRQNGQTEARRLLVVR
ncbi:MAG: T9SS type A sorting domain-containing protein [Candidatus Eisenbacteria sp.]|nr:T9SS type A sorting domain-containing protein [Candidatus Eisenbacteria bacterium]